MARVLAKDLVRSIRLQLGQDRGHGLRVEASDSQLLHSIRLSLSEYGRYFPIRSYQSFSAPAGFSNYIPNPPIRGVEEVVMVDDTSLILTSPEVGMLNGTLTTYGAAVSFDTPYHYDIYRVWKEMASEIYSNRPDYRWVQEDGSIYFYIPTGPMKVTVIGDIDLDAGYDEEDEVDTPVDFEDDGPSTPKSGRLDATLRLVPEANIHWIRKLSLAKSKEIVGLMRRKFGGVPGTDKQVVQMDGAELVREGREEWDKVLRDIYRSSPGLPPSYY